MPKEWRKGLEGLTKEEMAGEINEIYRERARVRMRTYLYKKKTERLEKQSRALEEAEQPEQKRGNRKRGLNSITCKVSLSGPLVPRGRPVTAMLTYILAL